VRRTLPRVNDTLVAFGVDLRKSVRSFKALPAYVSALRRFKAQAMEPVAGFPVLDLRPRLGEAADESGFASGHYFHQDLLVAQRVWANGPGVHVDVGSRVDGFVAHVASFRCIEVFDIRPLSSTVRNVTFVQADLTTPVGVRLVEYCDSLSCLHALEHFGLGRYGDTVDYEGHLRGMENLTRILKAGGTLYLSVPIGPQRIEFNAHRVFSVQYVLDRMLRGYRLERFSFVDDSGDLHDDVIITDPDAHSSFGCQYGCGIFEMTKL
jgi:SAM-dependent methyltransferase